MHQAARIARHEVFRLRLQGEVALHFAHGSRDGRELGGKRAAKAAADGLVHLHQLQTLHPGHQLARGVVDPHLAQAVAAVVVGDLVREPGPQVRHAQLVHEELRELVALRGDSLRQPLVRRAGEQVRVEDLHHRPARAAGDDHDLGVFQLFQHLPGDGAALVPVAGVEGGLSAARRGFRTLHRVPQLLRGSSPSPSRPADSTGR